MLRRNRTAAGDRKTLSCKTLGIVCPIHPLYRKKKLEQTIKFPKRYHILKFRPGRRPAAAGGRGGAARQVMAARSGGKRQRARLGHQRLPPKEGHKDELY